MRTLIIFCLFFLVLTACEHKSPTVTQQHSKKSKSQRQPAQKSPSQKQLLKQQMGFQLGVYGPSESASESCYDGRLEVFEDERGDLSLIIGGRPLATNIRVEGQRLKFRERNCVYNVQMRLQEDILYRREKRTCPDGVYTFTAKVQFQEESLAYTLRSLKDNKQVQLMDCELSLEAQP